MNSSPAKSNPSPIRRLRSTICVWVPLETQIERTMSRDECDRGEAERRIAAQLPIDEKREMADHVIDNSGTPEQTCEQVEALYAQLTL